jgi:HAD superfamily hydrolase (TIGR01509 family)
MMIKAVIFDMDGVIIDSEPIESLSWEKILREYGKEPIINEWGLVHPVGTKAFDYVMSKHGLVEDVEVIRNKKRKIYLELVLKNPNLMPGFLKLLKELTKQKIKIAVASNRYEEHVALIIEKLGVSSSFNALIGFSPDIEVKPAPDIYLKAAKALGVDPKNCIAIEDSEPGVIAAKAAGMKAIAVPNRYTIYQDFSKADKIVKSLSEITMPTLEALG